MSILVNLGVPFTGRHPILGGVLAGLDIDAIGRTGSCAEVTADAAFEPILVPVLGMPASRTLGQVSAFLWILHRDHGPQHIPKRDLQATRKLK